MSPGLSQTLGFQAGHGWCPTSTEATGGRTAPKVGWTLQGQSRPRCRGGALTHHLVHSPLIAVHDLPVRGGVGGGHQLSAARTHAHTHARGGAGWLHSPHFQEPPLQRRALALQRLVLLLRGLHLRGDTPALAQVPTPPLTSPALPGGYPALGTPPDMGGAGRPGRVGGAGRRRVQPRPRAITQ